MHHRKAVIAAVAALTALGGTAYAATTEQAAHSFIPPGAPSGYLQINPRTCRFVHREIDVKPTPNERYARAEDSRDDVKMNCLANRGAQLQYKSVFASGTGHTVTAQCPAGYYVSGGGSQSETTGSWPVGNDAWTVVRDHLSPRVLGVTAICIRVTQ
jgi:hypothetical protein